MTRRSLTTLPVGPRPRPRLGECDLLLPVLECYMCGEICRNERWERGETSDLIRGGVARMDKSEFHALNAPSITPVEYFRRLTRYACSSRSVFVAAFFYLHKLARLPSTPLRINSLSVHRLVLIAIVLATKFTDDVHYDNAHFAKVGGLELHELNMLELQLLKLLKFELYISIEEFVAFESHVLECVLDTHHPDYSMLPNRLRNLGYHHKLSWPKPEPRSPTSTMAVSFDCGHDER